MKKSLFAVWMAIVLFSSCAQAARITEFSVPDLDGNIVTQDILKNAKLTVFNVWATWCPPCLRELPDLGELAREMKDEDVQVVGLLRDWSDRKGNEDPDKIKKAKAIIKQSHAMYPHLRLTKELRKQLGEFKLIPHTLLVLRSGYIVRAIPGAKTKGSWKAVIIPVLEKLK